MYGYRSGWDRLESLRQDFDRLLEELTGRQARQRTPQQPDDPQSVPVNLFETDTELMVVAAMPGIEAPNVDVEVDDDRLTIRGEKRGPGQEHRRYLSREWMYGSYERTIDLPMDVDVERATATYGNGVVTIALPKVRTRRLRRIEIKPEEPKPTRSAA